MISHWGVSDVSACGTDLRFSLDTIQTFFEREAKSGFGIQESQSGKMSNVFFEKQKMCGNVSHVPPTLATQRSSVLVERFLTNTAIATLSREYIV